MKELFDPANSGSRSLARENLDAREALQEREIEGLEGTAKDPALDGHISVVGHSSATVRRSIKGSRYLLLSQAANMVEAVNYAREIGLLLVAHATVHWCGTDAGDDRDGKRFAKVREGFDKDLRRRGIPDGLTGVWCRECRAHTDIVHCHLLFHLPVEFRSGARLLQIEALLNRLVARHGNGLWGEFAVKLTIHSNPDGLYLLKGGNRDVWKRFKIRKQWRESQGIIHGKRCGTTENIGRAARQVSQKPHSSSSPNRF